MVVAAVPRKGDLRALQSVLSPNLDRNTHWAADRFHRPIARSDGRHNEGDLGELSRTAASRPLGESRERPRFPQRLPRALRGTRCLGSHDLRSDHAARRAGPLGRSARVPEQSSRSSRLRGSAGQAPRGRRRARHSGLEVPEPQPKRDSHSRDARHGGRRLAPLRARRVPPDRRGRGDDPRRRADTGAVPDDPRAAGPPDLALAHRHGPGSARRRRRRGRVPRYEAPPAHRRFDRAGGHPRRRRQGRHARGSPLERRTAKRQLVADASPRRRGPSTPLCHRPGRHAPKHADEHRGGCHLGHGHEADRRAGQRSPCRPRGGDGQRRGEPRRVGLDDDRDRQQRQRAHRGRLLQGRGRQRARLVLLHLDGVRVAGSRRERDRLLRCEGQLRLRRLKRDHDPRTTPRRSRPLP